VAVTPAKYAEQLADWLVDLGYDTCFFVAGGNIMHLLDAVRTRMRCIPVVHEVAAGIAAEYFNETRPPGANRAFALVTAGPGLTNIVTAVAGAWHESRELLVVGGQVKSSDLAVGGLRQRGIQEADGIALIKPVCKQVLRLERPVERAAVAALVEAGRTPRCGPVFLEVCLDVQAAPPVPDGEGQILGPAAVPRVSAEDVAAVAARLQRAERPVILLGGGVERRQARLVRPLLEAAETPVMTTWNGADRLPSDHPLYLGRPNTWGQRAANVILQQADLVIAVGTRLGLQQTGFNWQGFAPLASVIQIDIDPAELSKGHPRVDVSLCGDANAFLRDLLGAVGPGDGRWASWLEFGKRVRDLLPLREETNKTADGFVCPYRFATDLAAAVGPRDLIIPCSSGGAETVLMQALTLREDQIVVTDKGMASMGYGLSGAIGAAIANPDRHIVLVEGDGGFAQNLQELGTLSATAAAVTVFLFDNDGYASIRMTQRNYFGGAWIGCDRKTGLGLPDWPTLARAYDIPCVEADPADPLGGQVEDLLAADHPGMVIVPIDPEQTYYPKITSRVTESGGMESNPLHLMSPALAPEVAEVVLPYLPREGNAP